MATKASFNHTLQFWALYPFIKLMEWLPWPAAYAFGRFVAFLLKSVIKYRKQVVYQNIRLSFPHISETERLKIADSFYQYLGRLIAESFKSPSLTADFLQANIEIDKEARLVFEQAAKHKRVMIVSGHTGNWEWSGHILSLNKFLSFYSLYKPLKNPWFDAWIRKPRTRFGLQLIDMNQTTRSLLSLKEENCAVVFIADQAPDPQGAYVNSFLNQETQWYTGPEKLAKKLKWPVLFSCCSVNDSDKYVVKAQWITENPQQEPDNFITQKLSECLEAEIKARPHLWLWSHKRWKHTRKA